jgi:hypothetical protein
VAAAWAEWRACSEALEEARQKREHGLGRRPSAAAIARLQKRMGLALADYNQGLTRLQELCGTSRLPSIGELVQQRRGPEDGRPPS